jgi:hypothetical protein
MTSPCEQTSVACRGAFDEMFGTAQDGCITTQIVTADMRTMAQVPGMSLSLSVRSTIGLRGSASIGRRAEVAVKTEPMECGVIEKAGLMNDLNRDVRAPFRAAPFLHQSKIPDLSIGLRQKHLGSGINGAQPKIRKQGFGSCRLLHDPGLNPVGGQVAVGYGSYGWGRVRG